MEKIQFEKKMVQEKNRLLAIAIFFRQCTKVFDVINHQLGLFLAGNLDPLYIIAPLWLYQNRAERDKIKKLFILTMGLIIYALIQAMLLPQINLFKVIANVGKLSVCIMVMMATIDLYNTIDIIKICQVFTYLNVMFTVSALTIFQNSQYLWRFNDYHNNFAETRLQLFFLEPSELGFTLIIVILFILGKFLVEEDSVLRFKYVIYIAINCSTLLLAQSMGAIALGVVAVAVMLVHDLFTRTTKLKVIIYAVSSVVIVAIIALLYWDQNAIIMRILATINGDDPSTNYRLGTAIDVLNASMRDTNFLGCGFGNVGTQVFLDKYADMGLSVVIVNAIIYVVVESGIFGVLMLSVLGIYLIKSCIKGNSTTKWGLLVFVIAYQCVGSHFTSGLNWVIYGIIGSNYTEQCDERSFGGTKNER